MTRPQRVESTSPYQSFALRRLTANGVTDPRGLMAEIQAQLALYNQQIAAATAAGVSIPEPLLAYGQRASAAYDELASHPSYRPYRDGSGVAGEGAPP